MKKKIGTYHSRNREACNLKRKYAKSGVRITIDEARKLLAAKEQTK